MAFPKGRKHFKPPNSGRKKGSLNKRTLDKLQAQEALRQHIIASLGAMTTAQIAHAQGVGHLYRRDQHGKFIRIDDQATIDAILAEGLDHPREDGSTYWIFAKDPSVQAYEVLLNRALDLPPRPVAVEHSGGLKIVLELPE